MYQWPCLMPGQDFCLSTHHTLISSFFSPLTHQWETLVLLCQLNAQVGTEHKTRQHLFAKGHIDKLNTKLCLCREMLYHLPLIHYEPRVSRVSGSARKSPLREKKTLESSESEWGPMKMSRIAERLMRRKEMSFKSRRRDIQNQIKWRVRTKGWKNVRRTWIIRKLSVNYNKQFKTIQYQIQSTMKEATTTQCHIHIRLTTGAETVSQISGQGPVHTSMCDRSRQALIGTRAYGGKPCQSDVLLPVCTNTDWQDCVLGKASAV